MDATLPYFDLGKFARPIPTTDEHAQIWFNRGLIWSYGFNHDEGRICFEHAVRHDPSCAMIYWGVAYACGPNYNRPWAAMDDNEYPEAVNKCATMLEQACSLSPSASRIEAALIEALQTRIPLTRTSEGLAASSRAYADAMRRVYELYGKDDLDVAVLFVDSLMNIAPWSLFISRTGKPNMTTPVLEIQSLFDELMRRDGATTHPGLLHLYIHFTEMSAHPENAIVPADQLRGLVPHGGHLQHMPSHIYVLIGDYRQAIQSNVDGCLADDLYFAQNPAPSIYAVYRLHNLHSLIYAAMLAGQSKVALAATNRMEAAVPEELLLVQSPPLAEYSEYFRSVRVHVLIRFGMWDELKALTIPTDKDLYCVTVATIHYGKGIAWAATGDIMQAEQQRRLFHEALVKVPPTRLDFPNKVVDLLQVAVAMLDGEIEYRRGNFEVAFQKLRLAIERDDSLLYNEPWSWMVPTRHAFAALSLEQGRVEDALQAYAEDLGLIDTLTLAHQHPANIWALHGYYECLLRLDRQAEAHIIRQQLVIAAAIADIPIKTSCFCSGAKIIK